MLQELREAEGHSYIHVSVHCFHNKLPEAWNLERKEVCLEVLEAEKLRSSCFIGSASGEGLLGHFTTWWITSQWVAMQKGEITYRDQKPERLGGQAHSYNNTFCGN